MSAWTKPELQQAFDTFAQKFDTALRSGDFAPWLACLTDDVTYSERGAGIGWDRHVSGSAAVASWIGQTRALSPQADVRYRPVAWSIVDEERGWVVAEWRNRLADAGSGEVHEWRVYARLIYAGSGRWSFVEEIYNSTAARAVMAQWLADRARSERAGRAMPALDPAWGARLVLDEHESTQRWPREEIVDAVRHFEDVCQRAFLGHEHEEWVQCFSPDVVYRELAMSMDGTYWPELRGQGGVRDWINAVYNRFPIDKMMLFPISWFVVDAERGWVVLEWRNQMADPGTGELFEERSYTRLKYGGNRQWRFEEDIYDPGRMREMLLRWMEARRRVLGRPQTEVLMSLEHPPALGLPPVNPVPTAARPQ